MTLENDYKKRYHECLVPLARALEGHLLESMKNIPRIDRVCARAKSIDRFMGKATKRDNQGKLKYEEPLYQIQDQVGARIIVFYRSDIAPIKSAIDKYYKKIEARTVVPESSWEFGYFGQHYILHVPPEAYPKCSEDLLPEFFELQIKTLFQHAWSEAEHDLGYKPGEQPLTNEQLRMLAFTSAQAWGADDVFDRLFNELHQQ